MSSRGLAALSRHALDQTMRHESAISGIIPRGLAMAQTVPHEDATPAGE